MNATGYRVGIEAGFIPDMNQPETIAAVKKAADDLVAKFAGDLAALGIDQSIDVRLIKASVDFQPTMRVPDKPKAEPDAGKGK